ncbi:sensor histidine kinase [Ancylobacter lacus]|uniref:sensor histidine kinase n=1 Tax=Ancylobacter lacus TaxID=2579970 RepID=UPI001BCB030D|nr:PAS domain-containing sensor histidine kinase [Ancylobacter lacus]MBS7539304.1 PAS domain S-box protein [Ancylobacter lacus]
MTRWTDDPTPPSPSQTDEALRAAAGDRLAGDGAAVLVRADGVVIGATAAARARGTRTGALPADTARAIARIAATLRLDHPPRLERIRLPGRLVAETFACSLVTTGPARAVLLATPEMPSAGRAPTTVAPPVIEPRAAGAAPPAVAAGTSAGREPAAVRTAPLPRAPAPIPATETPPAGRSRALTRFIWRTGLDGRFRFVDPLLAAALGRPADTLAGSDWDELGAPRVQDRVRAGASFTGVRVTLAGRLGTLDAEVGGAPIRGEGMRGFGLLLAQASPAQAAPAQAAPAQAAPAPAPEAAPAPAAASSPSEAPGTPAPTAPPVRVEPSPSPATAAVEEAPARPAPPPLQETPPPPPVTVATPDLASAAPPAPAPASPAPADETPAPAGTAPRPEPGLAAPPAGEASPRVTLSTLAPINVIPLRSGAGDPNRLDAARASWAGLTAGERNAFREIARALGARLEGADDDDHETFEPEAEAPEPYPAEDDAALSPRDQTLRSLEEALRPATARHAAPQPSATQTSTEPPSTPYPPTAPGARAPEAGLQPPVPANDGLRRTLVGGERPILDRLPFGVAVQQGDRLVYANRTLLGWTGHEGLAALEAAGGLASLFTEAGAATDGETEADGPRSVSLAGPGGEALPVEVRLLSVPWDGGTALLYVLRRVVPTPLADERVRQAELALRAAEATARELRSILDTATDGVVLINRAGTILSFNRSAEALFGFEAAEIQGEAFTLLFAPESHRAAIDYLDGLATNGVASVLNDGREVIGREREGGLIPLFMTIGRVGEEADKYCAVLRDITQWKRAEEELTEAKRNAEKASLAKSDFLAKISHEIRTPLNAIIGFSEVMVGERFGPIGNERYRTYLRDIHASGEHLISLINDLLDLSKIEAGKLDLAFTSVALNEIIQQCMGIMQPQANRERIIIRSSLAAELPPVVADARSMRQIVLNLVSNSIKFTRPGGQVILSTALTELGEVVLRVRDTGIGMSEADIATAMEPFRQLPTSVRTTTEGTGLGLPLTKALAEANRATFSIRSAVDSGTMVEITFPSTRVLAE